MVFFITFLSSKSLFLCEKAMGFYIVLNQNSQTFKWNRIESPEIYPYIYIADLCQKKLDNIIEASSKNHAGRFN